MKDAATASFGSKGERIVKMNHDAIDRELVRCKIRCTNIMGECNGEQEKFIRKGDRKIL